MHDIKPELGAYRHDRHLRLAMKSLGWRERRAFAWGRRMAGFVGEIDRAGREAYAAGEEGGRSMARSRDARRQAAQVREGN
jgi:hypothetical protein